MFVFNHYNLNELNDSARVRYHWHATIMAGLLFICGVSCLVYPLMAGLYLGCLTGFTFLMCGIYTLYSLIVFRQQNWKSKIVYLFFAIVWLLLGYSFITKPVISMESLAFVFSGLFIIGGLTRIAIGLKMCSSAGFGWDIFIGILDLLIANLWISMDPQQTFLFTTVFIGMEMLFSAWGFIALRKKCS